MTVCYKKLKTYMHRELHPHSPVIFGRHLEIYQYKNMFMPWSASVCCVYDVRLQGNWCYQRYSFIFLFNGTCVSLAYLCQNSTGWVRL